MDGLAELAVDGVQPLWLAEAYGVPLRRAYRGVALLPPTGHWGRSRVRVPYAAWSREEASLAPRYLRHAMVLAVARWALGALAGEWEALAVYARRSWLRSRGWARREGERLKGVPRPDGEWWGDGALWAPWAVEVDAATMRHERILSRWEAWAGLYWGVIWVVLSPGRGESVAALAEEWLADAPGRKPYWRILWLKAWWEGDGYEWVR